MNEEQKLLKVLINFNFNSIDKRSLMNIVHKYKINELNNIDSSLGWREKLIKSFYYTIDIESRVKDDIIKTIFVDVNGKHIKTNFLALYFLLEKDKGKFILILKKYNQLFKTISRELKWSNAFLDIIFNEKYHKTIYHKKVIDAILFVDEYHSYFN